MPEGYARQWYEDNLEKNPEVERYAYLYFKRLCNGELGFLGDVFCQIWEGKTITMAEGYIVYRLFDLLYNGEIAFRFIDTIDESCSDEDVEGNQEIINHLPEPFRGKYWGGGNVEYDGLITWSKPVFLITRKLCKTVIKVKEEKWHNSQLWGHELGNRARLEVGYCNPETVFLHLASGQPLARFPYGYKKICLMEQKWYKSLYRLNIRSIEGKYVMVDRY